MICPNCGNEFDFDKNFGICPACGSYIKRETAPAQETAEEKERKETLEQLNEDYLRREDYHERHLSPKERRAKKEAVELENGQRKTGRILIAILLVTLLLMVVFSILFSKFSDRMDQKAEDERQEQLDGATMAEQSKAQVGEPIVLNEEIGACLEVTGVEAVTEVAATADFPEDRRLFAVNLYAYCTEDLDWEDLDAYGFNYVESNDQWFCANADGSYYRCLDSYDLEDYSRQLGGRADFDLYELFFDGSDSNGYIYLLVPSDTEELALTMTIHDPYTNETLQTVTIPLLNLTEEAE